LEKVGRFTSGRANVKPIRSDILCRRVGVLFTVLVLFVSLLATGCLLHKSPSEKSPTFSLCDDDARRAGALALYSQGLLLESGNTSNTNADKEAALNAFRQALRLDPDNRRALSALISNLTERERLAEALAELDAFLSAHPDDSELHLEAARIADAASRPADAARHCARILAAQPENRDLALALIGLYFQSDQDDAAFELLRSQSERLKDVPPVSLPLRWALHFTREGKDPLRALHCLKIAIGHCTNSADRAELTACIAENQLLLGQTNAAMASFKQAYRDNPSFTTPILHLGALWAQRPNATNLLARQAQREKHPEEALLTLAATQQALDDREGAIRTLRAFYSRSMRAGYFPSEGFYLWLGNLLQEQESFADTEHLLVEALATYPSSSEVKNFIAYMWAEKGIRLAEANTLANEALQDAPDNAAYLDTKGWILFKSKRAFDALQFLLRAAERDKDEPVILDHVGDALNCVGRENEAISFWTRSLQIDPQPAVADKLRKHNVALPKKP